MRARPGNDPESVKFTSTPSSPDIHRLFIFLLSFCFICTLFFHIITTVAFHLFSSSLNQLSLSSFFFTAVIVISLLSITFIPFYSCQHFFSPSNTHRQLFSPRLSSVFNFTSVTHPFYLLPCIHNLFLTSFPFSSSYSFNQKTLVKSLYFHRRILAFFLSRQSPFSLPQCNIIALSQLCSLSLDDTRLVNQKYISDLHLSLSSLFVNSDSQPQPNWYPVLVSCSDTSIALEFVIHLCTNVFQEVRMSVHTRVTL